ncbi:hypothetical protein HCY66_00740 [Acinetobacter radioresistens]|uniref:hypothetical protein n=1 Tax=Acinetobacter radioresistens TaxID=40216 RepID=UPI00200628ED|nr:hypothetical protein [Acinetobacter radioresistens]MCK4088610.1 hypothetical protein [Acinetobacter radioresistens]
MSKTVFDHEIFRIAHPVMQKLIHQAVQSKEFQATFPDLYVYLEQVIIEIGINLKHQLTAKYQEKTCLSATLIQKNIEIILLDRRLFDHVIGYCQTHELYLADEYLISDLLQHYEIVKIFNQSYVFFWDQIKEYERRSNDTSLSKILLIHLKKHNLYLPNLFPHWTIEQLFLDYFMIFIDYHKFNNSKVKSQNITRQPTAEEAKLALSRLFKYDSPLPAYNKSFIDVSSYDSETTSPEYLNLNIHLDEDLNNLPSIINDFLHHMIARKVDRLRNGLNTAIPINEVQFQKIHQIRNQMDIVVNTTSPLKRADTVLSALISLIFYEQVFKRKILDGDPIKFQGINYAKLLLEHSNTKISDAEKATFDLAMVQDLSECINRSDDYDLAQHMDKLYNLLSSFADIQMSTVPKNATPSKIESIFCTNNGAPHTHKISKDSLKSTIPDTLELLSKILAKAVSL